MNWLPLALVLVPQPMEPPGVPPERLAEVLAAPPLGDVYRFPPWWETERAKAFAREHQKWLAARYAWAAPCDRQVIEWSMAETRLLLDAWENLNDAQCEWRPGWDRRLHLADLRQVIGDDAFRRAEMPPPVPVWRFNQLR